MKRLTAYLLLFLLTLSVEAKVYSVESLPAIDSRNTWVSNPDGILSPATVDSINALLKTLDIHKVQCLVVTVTNIEDDDPYEFAIGLGRRFGVGGKESLGVVVVLATDDRSYQIVTGDGMEKFLPDAICYRIEEHAMVPYLKEGDWDNAMLAAVSAIKGYLDKEPEVMEMLRQAEESEDDDTKGLVHAFLWLIGILFVISVINNVREKRCPECKKYQLKKVSTVKKKAKDGGYDYTYTFICQNCGKEVVRKVHRSPSSGGGGFYIGGGGFGGGSHSSGGGFSGYGGGSFSGGGAGGRF